MARNRQRTYRNLEVLEPRELDTGGYEIPVVLNTHHRSAAPMLLFLNGEQRGQTYTSIHGVMRHSFTVPGPGEYLIQILDRDFWLTERVRIEKEEAEEAAEEADLPDRPEMDENGRRPESTDPGVYERIRLMVGADVDAYRQSAGRN